MSTMYAAVDVIAAFAAVPATLPNPPALAPPGADKILQIVSFIKWFALVALGVGFFGGIAVFAGGRVFDHHRIGRVGTIMMAASVAGSVLYAIGFVVLNDFAAGG